MKIRLCLAAFLLLAVSARATGTVTLAWYASPGTNVIAEYTIYYGVASRTYTNVQSAGTNLTLSVSNLVEGETYYFAATAVDSFGLESDYSTEVFTVIGQKRPEPAGGLRKVALLFFKLWDYLGLM
jgi:hypothetical protein